MKRQSSLSKKATIPASLSPRATPHTCIPCVHDEFRHLECPALRQTPAIDFGSARIPNLGLDHHDGHRAVGHVAAVLLDADQVFTHLPGDEGDPCNGAQTAFVRWGGAG